MLKGDFEPGFMMKLAHKDCRLALKMVDALGVKAPVGHAVLDSLQQVASGLLEPTPLVLVAVSGKESDRSPRQNKLMHEKLLYVEAVRAGLEQWYAQAAVTAMPQVLKEPARLQNGLITLLICLPIGAVGARSAAELSVTLAAIPGI